MSVLSNAELLLEYNKINRRRYAREQPRPESLWEDAEILWSGEHYLMIREGKRDGCRLTYLVSREGLLLRWGNPDKNPLVELALAKIHPVFGRDLWVRRELLHCSRRKQESVLNPRFKGRMSQSLQLHMIHYATKKDMNFEEDAAKLTAEFDEAMEFSRRNAEYAIEKLGEYPNGTIRWKDYEYPVGSKLSIRIGDGPNGFGDLIELSWSASRHNRRFNANISFPSSNNLTEEQFRKLVDLLAMLKDNYQGDD